jgi:hypothetical protein
MRVCVNAATRPASRRPRHRSWAAGLATLLRSVLLPHVCVCERERDGGPGAGGARSSRRQ